MKTWLVISSFVNGFLIVYFYLFGTSTLDNFEFFVSTYDYVINDTYDKTGLISSGDRIYICPNYINAKDFHRDKKLKNDRPRRDF